MQVYFQECCFLFYLGCMRFDPCISLFFSYTNPTEYMRPNRIKKGRGLSASYVFVLPKSKYSFQCTHRGMFHRISVGKECVLPLEWRKKGSFQHGNSTRGSELIVPINYLCDQSNIFQPGLPTDDEHIQHLGKQHSLVVEHLNCM